MSSLLRDLPAATPEILAAFGDETLLAAALAFETELARAGAAEGLLTEREAGLIAAACAAPEIAIATLAAEAAHAGTLAIPLVAHLRRHVAREDLAAAAKVHLGATSQDLADTALMLQAKAGVTLIRREAGRITAALRILTESHVATPMLGRTLLQAALPITFGLKTGQWLVAIEEALARFDREAAAALRVQFGGAAGTLAGLDGRGQAVARRLAAALGLGLQGLPWHARRNEVAGLAASLAILTGAAAKIARDISLLAQTEIGEVFEPRVAGRGGSSAMAHKRNPTGCQVILSAAIRTPGLAATILAGLPQEQERGLGGWQAEGPVLVDLFGLTHGALSALAGILEGLEVDAIRMRANLAAADLGSDTGDSVALAQAARHYFSGTDS
jgi:3-carboxy-cis,cis-muconate cycloisomerase